MTDPAMVLVRWVDSMSLESGQWMDAADIAVNLAEDALRQESVGYLVSEGDVAIALAGSRNLSDEDPHHRNTKLCGVVVIPRCAITYGPVALRISEAGGRLRGRGSGRRRERPAGTRRDEGRDDTMSEQQQPGQPGQPAQPGQPGQPDPNQPGQPAPTPPAGDDDAQDDDDDRSS